MLPGLPVDVLFLIKELIPLSDESALATHLALSNTSATIRRELYPTDDSFRALVHASNYSRPAYAVPGEETPRVRSWRQAALALARSRLEACPSQQVSGMEPGSEGVLGRVLYEPVCHAVWRRSVQQCALRGPPSHIFTPDEIAREKLELVIHPHLKRFVPNYFGLDKISDVRLTSEQDLNFSAPIPWSDEHEMARHPHVGFAFATYPPITHLKLWFGHVNVYNPDGITLLDCRLAMKTSDSLSRTVGDGDWPWPLSNGQSEPREADVWLALENGREDAFAYDGWHQEKKGSVRLGSTDLWVRHDDDGQGGEVEGEDNDGEDDENENENNADE